MKIKSLFILVIGTLLFGMLSFGADDSDKMNIKLQIKKLASQNLSIHFSAANSLVKSKKTSVPALIKCLQDDRWFVVITAAWALGEIKDKRAVKPLLELLKSEDTIGPTGYSTYIGNQSFKAQKDLALFKDKGQYPSWNLLLNRRAAAIALGKIGDKKTIEPLKAILNEKEFYHGTEANVAIAIAIKRITGEPLSDELEEELTKWTDAGYK